MVCSSPRRGISVPSSPFGVVCPLPFPSLPFFPLGFRLVFRWLRLIFSNKHDLSERDSTLYCTEMFCFASNRSEVDPRHTDRRRHSCELRYVKGSGAHGWCLPFVTLHGVFFLLPLPVFPPVGVLACPWDGNAFCSLSRVPCTSSTHVVSNPMDPGGQQRAASHGG